MLCFEREPFLVAHLPWAQGVVGSNPIAPTNKIQPSAVRSQLGHLSRILDWFKPEFDLSFSEGKRECESFSGFFYQAGNPDKNHRAHKCHDD